MALRKKLIEVALPLDAINAASAREKSIRHGHPSMLHFWWARRPLAAARVVIFAQTVDDPASWPEEFPTEAAQEAERQRLFRLIEQLVRWENTTNEELPPRSSSSACSAWTHTSGSALRRTTATTYAVPPKARMETRMHGSSRGAVAVGGRVAVEPPAPMALSGTNGRASRT